MPAPSDFPHDGPRLAAVHKVRLMGTPAEERFDRVTRLARRMFGLPTACIDIVGEKLVWLKSVQGFDGLERMRKDTYCHYTIQDDGVCLIRDTRLDPRVHTGDPYWDWIFYAGAPLHFEGERVGVLCVGDDKPRDFTPEQVESLIDLAALAGQELQVAALSEAQLALARANEELEMKTRIDVLTHLWNRRAILELAAIEMTRADHAPVAILMIDIDHFKSINDRLGHPAGDRVLRVVAERLRAGIRPMDAVGRFGGEEFLAILSDIDGVEALNVAERVRRQVARSTIAFDGHRIPVTCSIGLALSARPDDAESLIRRADQALYRAKRAGRNRVAIAPRAR
ncbi:diguanylate cyclase [Gluconacetobacter sacchari]|uniref:sensor domain-containing diguanylate cyclase n=1 Tax=Gluconacetobacter sacchari TaxID=92759 RepID=UPI0039B6968B